MSIGNRMRGLGESVYYLDVLKPKMDELMGDVSYELNHEVGKRKLLVRLDGFGEEYKPQIETLMDEELPVGYRMEYDPFPLDFIRLDFLEGNKNIVKTGYVPTPSTGMRVDGYYRAYTTAGPIMGHYTKSSLRACIPYPRWAKGIFWFRGTSTGQATVDDELNIRHIIALNYLNSNQAQWGKNVFSSPIIGEGFTDAITIGGYGGTPSNYVLYSAQITEGAELKRNFIPALNREGKPCVFDLVTREPFYSYTSGQFIAGLTMKQALNLAKLPTPSDNNNLTISLPKEATLVQHNQQVEAALTTAAEKGWNIPVQYREAGEEAIYNKYAECKTVADIVAVNPDYENDLTDEGEWIYPLTNLVDGERAFYDAPIKKFSGALPNVENARLLFRGTALEGAVKLSLPKATTIFQMFGYYKNKHKCKITEIELDAPMATDANQLLFTLGGEAKTITKLILFAPKLSNFNNIAADQSAFREFWCDTTNVHYAGNAFNKCILNKESALGILNTNLAEPLSSQSGQDTIAFGVHTDHENDEEIISAVAAAEAKGWIINLQWNGTKTAQASTTYGLRRKPIYAKVGTVELPDGTIEQYLSWGHYVTNWEENGYQEFASLEEAYEHFNLEMETEE